MIDLHCHIIPGIDDGASDNSVAIEMCRIAIEDGIKGIIATPHYIHGELNNESTVIESKLQWLKTILYDNGIDINIYPGCEAFISLELPELVQQGKISTLNNSSYLLIELPSLTIPDYTHEVIYRLKIAGFTPIIAHPERNPVIANNLDLVYELIERGALMQLNSTSIRGVFGKKTKETSIKLLKRNLIHLVASDSHTTKHRAPRLTKARYVIEEYVGKKTTDTIFDNAQRVLYNEQIEPFEMRRNDKPSHFKFSKNIKRLVANIIR